jgi:hypothetical protein
MKPNSDNDALLETIAREGTVVPYRKGQVLFCQGDPSDAVLWPFRVLFRAPLTWLTAFRSPYLPPQLASLSITHWLTGGHDKQILDSLMHCGPMATVYAFGGGRSWVVKEFAGRAGSAGQQGMGGRFVPPPIFSGRPCASNRRADRQSPVGSGALRKLGATARPVVRRHRQVSFARAPHSVGSQFAPRRNAPPASAARRVAVCFSAPRSQGNCVSRARIAAAVVSVSDGVRGMGGGGIGRRARRARWLRL